MTFRYSSLLACCRCYLRCTRFKRTLFLYITFLLFALPKSIQAQTWQQALNGNSYQPNDNVTSYDPDNPSSSWACKTAVDARGNVFVTGKFRGTITFGNTRLSDGGYWMARYAEDVFVAKWDVAAQKWAWAVSGGGYDGTDDDIVNGIAVSGNNVYITGSFPSGSKPRYAGTTLIGAGNKDIFLAKYIDNGTSVSNGWAISQGGPLNDEGTGVAANGDNVYVTGFFYTDPTNNVPSISIAGTTLTNGGTNHFIRDVFVAKYTDAGQSVRNGWATSGAGVIGYGQTAGIAVNGNNIYVAGSCVNNFRIAGTLLNLPLAQSNNLFIAKYIDMGASVSNGWAIAEGGLGNDVGHDIAVSGANIYVTGGFDKEISIAGTWLSPSGLDDMFLAKYIDEGPNIRAGWATSGGGYSSDVGFAVAANQGNVYVTGLFDGRQNARFAGTLLTGHNNPGLYVAKYIDNGMSFSNGWAANGGGTHVSSTNPFGSFFHFPDVGSGIGVSQGKVYVVGGTGSGVANYGTTPELLAPRNSAMLGCLDTGTGSWRQVEGPFQGGTSTAYSTTADNSGNVYITGSFRGTVGFGTFRLTSAGGSDMFLAKWHAPTATWVWATRAGGPTNDNGYKVVREQDNVYVTGRFTTHASIAGALLQAVDSTDVFLAKYIDNGTTISSGWAISEGSRGNDAGQGLAVSGSNVYVTGYFASGSNANFAGQALTGAGKQDMFVAKYIDTGLSVQKGWAISGGGTRNDSSHAVAVSGANLYITGEFTSSTNALISGTKLNGTGSTDMFLAKYIDEGASVRTGWATSGGGSGNDHGYDLAVNGQTIYVTGEVTAMSNVLVGGTLLPQAFGSASRPDMFIAKYVDQGSTAGNSWATNGVFSAADGGKSVVVSGRNVYVAGYTDDANYNTAYPVIAGTSFFEKNGMFVAKYVDEGNSFRNGWAANGGGAGAISYGLAVQGNNVFVAGCVEDEAHFRTANQGLHALNNTSGRINFLGHITDATVLATRQSVITAKLQVFPNPTHSSATLQGASAGAAVQVVDILGRVIARTTADSFGTAHLPSSLPAGVYTVRAADHAVRLVVE
ncbi:T9SS type A sorting domain-containing protein [Hymenobacter wooponensis]|uniref:T9SS type A sorting domain-containing protein n=1 Tax=Hymenobacter wooponensis TaxID=1525360 RepID=A0A4Z0MLX3_9BACT|nr:T9SS type A sorting domain-containing protein [Hymenobacter wooponensis]TGD80753.1 T9SS type A sorting domain-containing protein [Hymenobacter wooponensis]